MLMVDIIRKKRDGNPLSKEEIEYFINEYVKGSIPDYQISALMMAIYFRGMNDEETVDLTLAMMNSGDVLDLSGIDGVKVDKHSTGGVGDKTSLVLTPLVASLGVPVAKMSGRGLGHTGGTIDKLESFEGFTTGIDNDKFVSNVKNVGIAIMGQTADLAPADKLLYALRDVTATVDNVSLIASSIMSKKLAAGADAIVLDVKCGSGAFMKTEEAARELATKMVSIGKLAKKNVIAVISDMDQPLGCAVGNALEVKEAIDTLNGKGPEDFTKLCLELGSCMVYLGKKASSKEEAYEMCKENLYNGKAFAKFCDFIEAQGGNRKQILDPALLPCASKEDKVCADKDGYIESIMCEDVGVASLLLGGGRRQKSDTIDLSVGLIMRVKVGDKVKKGDTLCTLYANDANKLEEAKNRLKTAFAISDCEVSKHEIIKGIIS